MSETRPRLRQNAAGGAFKFAYKFLRFDHLTRIIFLGHFETQVRQPVHFE